MNHAVIWHGVVVEETINMIQPKIGRALRFLQVSEALDVAHVQMACDLGHLPWSRATARLQQLGQSFEEKAAIDEDGDSPDSHMRALLEGSPTLSAHARDIERATHVGRMWRG